MAFLPRISGIGRDMVPPGTEFDSTLHGAYIPVQNSGLPVACNATQMDEKWQSLWWPRNPQWYAPFDIHKNSIISTNVSTNAQLDAAHNFTLNAQLQLKTSSSTLHAEKFFLLPASAAATTRVGTRTQVAWHVGYTASMLAPTAASHAHVEFMIPSSTFLLWFKYEIKCLYNHDTDLLKKNKAP